VFVYTRLVFENSASFPYEYVDSESCHADSPTVSLCRDQYRDVKVGRQLFLLEAYGRGAE
jgi:hypothetical protein